MVTYKWCASSWSTWSFCRISKEQSPVSFSNNFQLSDAFDMITGECVEVRLQIDFQQKINDWSLIYSIIKTMGENVFFWSIRRIYRRRLSLRSESGRKEKWKGRKAKEKIESVYLWTIWFFCFNLGHSIWKFFIFNFSLLVDPTLPLFFFHLPNFSLPSLPG